MRINDIATLIQTTDASELEGGADHIQGNDGDDIIIGGVGSDELHGEAFLADGLGVDDLVGSENGDPLSTEGADILIGDEGRLFFNIATDEHLVTPHRRHQYRCYGRWRPEHSGSSRNFRYRLTGRR